MSEIQLKAFIAKAKDDQTIQDKLKAAKSPKEVVAIAKEHGHEFTVDNITLLSEEDLENVSGGGLDAAQINELSTIEGVWSAFKTL